MSIEEPTTENTNIKQFYQHINSIVSEEILIAIAKRDTALNYLITFLPIIMLLWIEISKLKYDKISSLAFGSLIFKKHTKDISAINTKAIASKYRHPPRVIHVIQQDITTNTTKLELAKLQLFNYKHINQLR